MKIRITGGSGSGKSTLGRKLADFLGVEHVEMDNLRYDFSKTTKYTDRRTDEELLKLLDEVLKKESWVIDGSYYKLSKHSYEQADLLIYLKVSIWKRLVNVTKRSIERWKEGRPEGILSFLDLVWWNIKSAHNWKRREKDFKRDYSEKLHVFGSADEAFEWFKEEFGSDHS